MSTKKKIIIGIFSAVLSFFIIKLLIPSNKEYKVKTGPVVDAVYALGTVKSSVYFNLRIGSNSAISDIYAVEGSFVKKGDPLLMTSDMVLMRSPISGIVTELNYKKNEIVSPNSVIMSVVDMKSLYVKISLDQESILRIKKNQRAEVSFEMLRNKKVSGKVISIYPSGGEFIVHVALDSVPEEILPEMTCDTAIEISRNPEAVMIPAVSLNGDEVEILRKGKKFKLKIKTQMIDGDWLEVTDGSILPGDVILAANGNKGQNVNKKKR